LYFASIAPLFETAKKIRPVNPMDKEHYQQVHALISIHRTWQGDHLIELDHIRVVQLLEDFNLTYGRERELQ
jgi:hypothetical protein